MSQVVTLENFRPPDRFDSVPWAHARIEEGETETGAFTVIDTQDLDPVDADPSVPQLRSFTTDNGTGPDLWYRIVFLDGAGGVSLPTDPVQNTLAAGDAFVLASELADRLGLTFTDEERDRADTLLQRASGVIRDETGQTIDLVTDDTYERVGTSDSRIPLPRRPVVSVASVTIDDVEISDWYLAGSELVRGRRPSVEDLVGGWASGGRGFGSEARTLTIVYTHGYAAIPQTVKSIAIEMAVRVWVNPGSVVQETIAGTGSTYAPYSAPPRGLMLTDSERAALRRLFGRRAHSVTIGGG